RSMAPRRAPTPMLRHLARQSRRALTGPRYYGGGLFKVFATEPAFLWAQAIAFKVLVTLLPLILLATGIFGLVLRQEDPFSTVSTFLRSFLPPGQSDALVQLVFQLQEASGTVTAVGAVALLVTVVTLFSTLRFVIAAAMGTSRHRVRPLLPGYLFDLRMVVQVGSLFVLSFALTFAVGVLTARSGAVADLVGLDPDAVRAVGQWTVRAVAVVVPYLLTLGMLAQLYYFVPRPHPPLRSALVGAAVGALLFEAAKNGFAIYATTVGGFDQYDAAGEALGGLGGVFGLVLAFVVWIYFSGLILIVGTVVTSLHERRLEPRQAARRRVASRLHRHPDEASSGGDVVGAAAPGPSAPVP
ncbi:MAG TPA: YihY/virulence factor BrkB family protein, partial [Rubricoccaceae bacterium]